MSEDLTNVVFPKQKTHPTVMPIMELNTSAPPFLLTGFVGLEKAHHWISIPLSVI